MHYPKTIALVVCTAAFAAVALSAFPPVKSPPPDPAIRTEWKGAYGDTTPVVTADLAGQPHRQMQALAESLSRVLAGLPRNYDGYTVEWQPGEHNESGSFRVTAWRKSDKPEVRL